jgi:hypothetical protein
MDSSIKDGGAPQEPVNGTASIAPGDLDLVDHLPSEASQETSETAMQLPQTHIDYEQMNMHDALQLIIPPNFNKPA